MTLDEMARLHAAAFVMPRPWSATEIAALLDSPLCFVIHRNDGFLMGRVVADEAELLTVAVDPGRQGRGIGRALVQDFVTQAAQRGAQSAFLEVAETNHAARVIYGLAGFTATGRRKAYYKAPGGNPVDALIMTRNLPDVDAG